MSTKATPSALADLRAVSPHHATNLTTALSVSRRQAERLRAILGNHYKGSPLERLACLLRVTVTTIRDLPVPGTAFWGNGHWNIHLREQDPADTQVFNALHELKHIIDHPGRRAARTDSARLSDQDEELVADHFATCVLTGDPA
jgi:hypothetical protein